MAKSSEALKMMQAAIGKWIYVWGGKGEEVSSDESKRLAWFRKRETNDSEHTKEQNVQRDEALYQKRVKAGVKPVQAADCSGLVSYVLMKLGLIKSRLSSRSLYTACEKNTDKTGFGRADLKPGDLVFKHNGTKIHHVAMYKGNNIVVEMAGRDIGAQERKISAKDNRYGRIKGMQDKDPDPEPTPPEPTPPVTYGTVLVKGNSVNVRKGPGKGNKTLKTVHKGNKFPLLNIDKDSGWYHIQVTKDQDGWISNRADLTEVIANG